MHSVALEHLDFISTNSVASSLLCAIGGLQRPLEVMSLLMVLSVESNWNPGYGTSELFVFSTFRIWLHLTPGIPDVDDGKEPTLRGSNYIITGEPIIKA